MILYTYRSAAMDPASRWWGSDLPGEFFGTLEEARRVILCIRSEITSNPRERWSPVNIERVELAPLTRRSLLTLLNRGIGPLVRRCEVVETIE